MYEAIMLGIIQGITEWLPISSSGQLVLFLLNFSEIPVDQILQYSVWLHFGTAFAAIYYFKSDLFDMIKKSPKEIRKKNSVFTFLVISTLISGAVGFGIYKLIKGYLANFEGNAPFLMAAIGFFLVITGILQRVAKKSKVRNIKNLTIADGVILGLVQAFAIVPGLSRSGLTTSTLLFRKFQNHAALKLSFLMSIPLVLGAQLGLGLTEVITLDINSLLTAVVTSFIVGLITIKMFMRLAQKVNFSVFCIIMGLLAFLPLIFSLF